VSFMGFSWITIKEKNAFNMIAT